jgi:hypothetical protein
MATRSRNVHELLELNELASVCAREKLLPRPINYLQLWRWCRKGIKTAAGVRIKLAHKRIAGKLYSDRESLRLFIEGQNKADKEHFDKVYPAAPNPREVQRRVEKLKQEAAAI